jgi:hypothetical protein
LACKGTQRVCLDTIRPPSGRVEPRKKWVETKCGTAGGEGGESYFHFWGANPGRYHVIGLNRHSGAALVADPPTSSKGGDFSMFSCINSALSCRSDDSDECQLYLVDALISSCDSPCRELRGNSNISLWKLRVNSNVSHNERLS